MEAPRLPSFFKTRRAKQFEYKPWFYDPEKEEKERRRKLLTSGHLSENDESKVVFESKLRERWKRSNSSINQRSRSNIRLLIITALLLWISYFLLK